MEGRRVRLARREHALRVEPEHIADLLVRVAAPQQLDGQRGHRLDVPRDDDGGR